MSGGATGRLSRRPRFPSPAFGSASRCSCRRSSAHPFPSSRMEPPAPASWLVAARARAVAPPRRRTAVVRHGRTARLSAAGAAVDRGRAGGTQPLPPPRRGTGRAAGPSHAAGVRRDTRAPRSKTGSCWRKRPRSIAGSPPRSPGWCRRWPPRVRTRSDDRVGRHTSTPDATLERRGPRAPCRRSPDAAVPRGPRRLGRGLARVGAAAIGARCRRAGIGGVVLPWYWGRVLAVSQPIGFLPQQTTEDGEAPRQARQSRVSEMRRRPRAREAAEDEDDNSAGTWVIRADEPQESVEDPCGLQRPTDRDDAADPEGLADSLSELPEARMVRTPGQAREVLRSGEEIERGEGAALAPVRPRGLVYPEWDYRLKALPRAGARSCESRRLRSAMPRGSTAAMARHARLARRVRARFERLRPRHVRLNRQAGRLRARHRRLGQHLRRHSRRRDSRRSPVCRAPALASRAGGRAAGRRQRLHRRLGLEQPAHRRRREGSAARGVRGARRARRPLRHLRLLRRGRRRRVGADPEVVRRSEKPSRSSGG